MPFPIAELSEVERFILAELPQHPDDIAKVAGQHFDISRQAVGRYLRRLVALGFLTATGATRQRRYSFATLSEQNVWVKIAGLQEDRVWTEHVAPVLGGVSSNVLDICRYGVTEIVNNAIDHSGSDDLGIVLKYSVPEISIMVIDHGVGIFRKIKEDCGLEDERHAILELTKGKLTTDPEHHTGEGIFFTSRMFDRFGILSGTLYVGCTRGGHDWLLESRANHDGTSVHLTISPTSTHTTTEVFDRYSTEQDDYAFNRTHVVVDLARQCQDGEKLTSRSQAKRVMARLERFKEVMLDFASVDEIGPAFADEIFRVWANEHPGTHIAWTNTSEPVNRMIRRALAARSGLTSASDATSTTRVS